MLRSRRAAVTADDVDPGPVQIQARKVSFDVSDVPLHWIPGHPAASHVISVLNLVLPAGERWFVETFDEALPMVTDPHLADDIRGFIGQEATHADVHDTILHDFMVERGVDPSPILAQVEHVFSRVLAPIDSPDPAVRLNHLCERLWLIAAIEHYTAVMGDFALNCTWDDHGADPTLTDLFRWHGSEEVEHRSVAHDVATYFHDSYLARIRAMTVAASMLFVFFQRTAWYLVKTDPDVTASWWRFNRMRMRDSKLGLLPRYSSLFGSSTLTYFRRGYSPEQFGSTAQAVAYLASSPAARAAHL
ncbi:metal-dependent hydrolase [Mycolicibacterium obuense]|uniref:Metal-dependent hydrolase n=1 Tax=Mycolicibacterium obuense TaxID=1807 RepID=A0A0J6VRL7_9MYCO|nr:metal-dependent hydrolase [Mycolicibacterium obuense]KKE98165.1 metal-dependent hydrolase [Mycolicibacterium obuense]KMO72113.1 putative metal-dependent hydrolase [Mycolicibacterium obuense]OKH70033.1 metal-dependent hydrolase [Mycobacterium sp. SWH-M1]TDL07280.1 metal-dependent hydrolase [Mycolicibacterium obuense]